MSEWYGNVVAEIGKTKNFSQEASRRKRLCRISWNYAFAIMGQLRRLSGNHSNGETRGAWMYVCTHLSIRYSFHVKPRTRNSEAVPLSNCRSRSLLKGIKVIRGDVNDRGALKILVQTNRRKISIVNGDNTHCGAERVFKRRSVVESSGKKYHLLSGIL